MRKSRLQPRYSFEDAKMDRPWKSDFHSRTRDWEDEIDRFRRDFFRNTPFEDGISREPRLRLFQEGPSYFESASPVMKNPEPQMTSPAPHAHGHPHGHPHGHTHDHTHGHSHADDYYMEFELPEFQPEDVSVKVENTHLTISAKQETNGNVREMSKTVEIPPHVDPEKLISHFSPNGILTVETLQPPCYESVRRCSQTASESELADAPPPPDTPPSNAES